MAGVADKRLEELLKRAGKTTPTPPSTSEDTPTDTPTPTAPHTSRRTSPPTSQEEMVRTQIYLRRDQIDWLEYKAKQAGKGVTRSDWIRYYIDKGMESDRPTS